MVLTFLTLADAGIEKRLHFPEKCRLLPVELKVFPNPTNIG